MKLKKTNGEEVYRWVKVYKIRVEPSISKFWYHKLVGEEFNAVLITKSTADSVLRCVFAIVEKHGDMYKPATMPRTIRPEDCVVVSEEVTSCNINMYHHSFQ